jgi:hypothetical protein
MSRWQQVGVYVLRLRCGVSKAMLRRRLGRFLGDSIFSCMYARLLLAL